MEKIFQALHEAIERGEDTILATVTASSGATPRGAGARMLVGKDGRLAGTVGGGAVELHSIDYAKEALEKKTSYIHRFIMTKNQVEDIGMICGGNATVHYLYLRAEDPALREVVELALDSIRKRCYAWLVTDLSEQDSLGLALYRPEARSAFLKGRHADCAGGCEGCRGGVKETFVGYPSDHPVTKALLADKRTLCRRGYTIEAGGRTLFTEELIIPGMVYIFGGGHVAQALVPALAAVDFAPVVFDDRDEFVDPALFPGAFAVKKCDLLNIGAVVDITDRDYVCIMTRGHSHDLEVEDQTLRTPARYIGVIGSRHKIKTVNKTLKERGFTDEDLARITTPIGLDIGGETPAEIAVSITAQLIMERSKDYKKIKH